MSAETIGATAGPTTPRAIARARRRASLRTFWTGYRRDREGMTGLMVLAVFVLIALSSLFVNDDGLSVVNADGPLRAAPSLDYPLGTDLDGRSVLTMIYFGTRISLLVGVCATLISMVIGTLVGICAGHFRGVPGGLLDRLTDWFLVIPFLPLAIVLATVLGHSYLNIILVIGVTGWSGTARLIRAQTMAIEARPYLERAKALGAGHWHQMTRHVLPNVMPLVFANTTLTVSISILAETTLSFLGLGDPLNVSWGTILDQAYSAASISNGLWWWAIFPGIAVVIVVRAFNMCGRAMERILDPRIREAR
jgi:peptide/nickel transport system permease protein